MPGFCSVGQLDSFVSQIGIDERGIMVVRHCGAAYDVNKQILETNVGGRLAAFGDRGRGGGFCTPKGRLIFRLIYNSYSILDFNAYK
jgi:hypothetical protein